MRRITGFRYHEDALVAPASVGPHLVWWPGPLRAVVIWASISVLVAPRFILQRERPQSTAPSQCSPFGGPGAHVLNLGHGVLQPTPEGNVQAFVDAARKWGTK